MEYMIARSSISLDDLEQKVNQLLAVRWVPQGGLTIKTTSIGQFVYLQAMVLNVPVKENP